MVLAGSQPSQKLPRYARWQLNEFARRIRSLQTVWLTTYAGQPEDFIADAADDHNRLGYI